MFGWFSSLFVYPQRTAKILFWYWALTAVAFGLFTFVVSVGADTDAETIFASPSAAFSLGYACTNLLMMGLLRYAQREGRYLYYFAIFAIVQQLSCANIPGAVLAFTLMRASYHAENQEDSVHPGIFWAAVGALGFVSFIFFFGQLSLLFS